MAERKPISKKLRFEVFERDKEAKRWGLIIENFIVNK